MTNDFFDILQLVMLIVIYLEIRSHRRKAATVVKAKDVKVDYLS